MPDCLWPLSPTDLELGERERVRERFRPRLRIEKAAMEPIMDSNSTSALSGDFVVPGELEISIAIIFGL